MRNRTGTRDTEPTSSSLSADNDNEHSVRYVANPKTAASPRQPSRAAYQWHRERPDYAPTPLIELKVAAAELNMEAVWAKDETARFGLPAFKILGASWAIHQALERLSPSEAAGATLVTATDGNHGRAVARVAGSLGLQAQIFVPHDMNPIRIAAIRAEGAEVEVTVGNYDHAVERAAEVARDSPTRVLISDTGESRDDTVSASVIDGYSTLFWELEHQIAAIDAVPDLLLIQIGVGSLAASAARFVRHQKGWRSTSLVGVEPLSAACAQMSIAQQRRVALDGDYTSIMVGLNAGRVSATAWDDLRAGFNGFLAIDDASCRDAMRLLRMDGISAGETGAAGLAGLLKLRSLTNQFLLEQTDAAPKRALVIATEGETGVPARAM